MACIGPLPRWRYRWMHERDCAYHEPELPPPPPPPTLPPPPPENPPPSKLPPPLESELDGGVCVLDHDWPVL